MSEQQRTDRDTDFEPVMSAEEALMWRVGSDPWLDPSGGLLAVLDQPVDVGLVRRKLAAGVLRFPRMAERVVESANPLDPPRWETDPHFDVVNHVVELSVAEPGDHRTLLDLTARLMTEPFPENGAPWLMYVIQGLAGDKSAVLTRLHHAVADGIGSLRMAEIYIDFERATTDPGDVDLADFLAERRTAETSRNSPDPADVVVGALMDGLGLVKSAAAEFALIGADPARAGRAGNHALETLRTVIDQLVGDPYLDSTSELWSGRSGQRYLVTAQMPLDAAKAAAKARGGTVNDLYVSALADAAVTYHTAQGEEPRSIAMSFVRSTREGANAGGNSFVPVKVRAPGAGTDADARFAVLREAMAPGDGSEEPGLSAVSSLAGLVPTAALSRLGRDQGSRIDIVTSNLRGAPVPLYVAGAKVEAAFPIGPVAGAACNATVMSNDGSLDVGIMIDPDAIDDPDFFGDCVQQVFDRYAAEVEGT
ncbi:MAG: wax ester/triacylglycerol synthase domain-containing protein [Actinomycetota bacterium]